jgi:CDP-glycerol glycerophosphotransferase
MITGLPRNDELYHNKYDIDNIKKKLNIPKDKKVILYAPTVRGNNVDEDFRNFINPPIDFNNWKRILGEYVILFRAHYFVDKIDEIKGINLDNVINVTSYENLNELMVVSDLLISDYSSIFFDYAILEKPMFCFAYDYDEYIKYQGLYLDINKEIPNGIIRTEKELLYMIKNLDYSEQVKKTIQFKKKYLSGNGKATQQVVDYIFNNTKNS